MRRLLASTILAVAAAAAALVLGASSASAATTWTIAGESNDHQVTATSSDTVLNTPRTTLRCTSASSHVSSVDNGSGQSNPLGAVDNLTFNNCTLAGIITFTVDCNADGSPSGGPWALNADDNGYDPTADTVTGGIDGNISCHVHGTNAQCEIDVQGSHVKAVYSNPDATLRIPGDNQNLTTNNVVGCNGLIDEGGPASFSGTFPVDFPDDLLTIRPDGV